MKGLYFIGDLFCLTTAVFMPLNYHVLSGRALSTVDLSDYLLQAGVVFIMLLLPCRLVVRWYYRRNER